MNYIDFLTNNTVAAQTEAEYKHIRFSEQAGEDVVFGIHALTFDEITEIGRIHDEDFRLYVALEGLTGFKNKNLMKKYGVNTYDGLMKKVFLPGEIAEICNRVMALSGYAGDTVEEIKKK